MLVAALFRQDGIPKNVFALYGLRVALRNRSGRTPPRVSTAIVPPSARKICVLGMGEDRGNIGSD